MNTAQVKNRRRPQKPYRPQGSANQRPSRSAQKRASSALQKLGEELTLMTPAARQELELPRDLLDALDNYDSTKSREGKRRQKQYIGKLMRHVDAGAIARGLMTRRSQIAGGPEWLAMAKNYTGLLLTVPEKELTRVLKRFLALTVPGMLGEPQNDALKNLRELAVKARAENPMDHITEGNGASHELFDALAALLPVTQQAQPEARHNESGQ